MVLYLVGAVWIRIMDDYGHIDDNTPSFAVSVLDNYRRQGIGSQLMVRMLELLKWQGYEQASLAVQKANYLTMYQSNGFGVFSCPNFQVQTKRYFSLLRGLELPTPTISGGF